MRVEQVEFVEKFHNNGIFVNLDSYKSDFTNFTILIELTKLIIFTSLTKLTHLD